MYADRISVNPKIVGYICILLSKAYPLCICKQMEILIKFNILVFLEFIISLLKFSQLLGKYMY